MPNGVLVSPGRGRARGRTGPAPALWRSVLAPRGRQRHPQPPAASATGSLKAVPMANRVVRARAVVATASAACLMPWPVPAAVDRTRTARAAVRATAAAMAAVARCRAAWNTLACAPPRRSAATTSTAPVGQTAWGAAATPRRRAGARRRSVGLPRRCGVQPTAGATVA
jgi:hypothetical protein